MSPTSAASSGGWQHRSGDPSATDDKVQDPDNLVELAALERMIHRSDGFRIAFAVTNHPALRDRLIRAVRRDLPDLVIAELTVTDAPATVVTKIESAARPPPGAVFVVGLDELGSDQARSRVIAELNLNRDHLWRVVPVPIVLWASHFAIRQFAAEAIDLWSGRSGLYRFRAEDTDNAGTIAEIVSRINWGTTPDERREREALLHDLLDESGDDTKKRAQLLVALGDAASAQSRYNEACELYEQALPIHRGIGDRLGEANTLKSLGDTALAQNRYYEAREFKEQNLPRQRGTGHPDRRIEKSVPSPPALMAADQGGAGGRVFLSYAREDLALAREVHQWLVKDGRQVLLDQDLNDGTAPGEDWEQRLHMRLRWADAVVCVVTSAYVKSVWNTAEVAIARALGARLLPIRAEPGVTHPLLTSIQHADMTRDPMDARAVLTQALRWIEATGERGWPDDRSPFPGLRPFDVDQHRVFFGRADEVGQLAGLLRSPSLRTEGAALLVVGPSGCGKSSLVRAGLVPAMAGEPGWLVLPPILPGVDPVVALARELTTAARRIGLDWTVSHIHHQLEVSGLTALADELLVADASGPQQRLLVVVDHFEELLTQASPPAAGPICRAAASSADWSRAAGGHTAPGVSGSVAGRPRAGCSTHAHVRAAATASRSAAHHHPKAGPAGRHPRGRGPGSPAGRRHRQRGGATTAGLHPGPARRRRRSRRAIVWHPLRAAWRGARCADSPSRCGAGRRHRHQRPEW